MDKDTGDERGAEIQGRGQSQLNSCNPMDSRKGRVAVNVVYGNLGITELHTLADFVHLPCGYSW